MSNSFSKIADWFAKRKSQEKLFITEYDDRPFIQRIIIFATFLIMCIWSNIGILWTIEDEIKLFLLFHYIKQSKVRAISKSQIDI